MATSLRSDVEVLRMALEQFGQRFKIGHHHAQLVAYFLDRATYPTYDKLTAHYPDHPRPGAPSLHPQADFGICVLNALNIKRGYWRIKKDHHYPPSGSSRSTGPSPFAMTPESGGGVAGVGVGARIETESPQEQIGSASRSGSASHTTTLADVSTEEGGSWSSHIGVGRAGKARMSDFEPSRSASWGTSSKEGFYKVHPDGHRHLFGSVPKDATAGVGARLDLPAIDLDMHIGGAGIGDSLAESGTGAGTQAPSVELTAETAAWFMGPEPGGFYTTRDKR
jgi:hypothetical protein